MLNIGRQECPAPRGNLPQFFTSPRLTIGNIFLSASGLPSQDDLIGRKGLQ